MRSLRHPREHSARRRRSPLPALVAVLLAVAVGPSPAAARPRATLAGRPLAEVLRLLVRDGYRLVYTDRVVRPEMRVEQEPTAGDPLQVLLALLSPHGLAVRAGPHGTLIVVRDTLEETPESPPAAAATFAGELTVTPSRLALLDPARSGTLGLGRDEIAATPHLGDDLWRAVSLLPGVAGTDVSAEFHVRGGRRDEILIRLDGQELFDVFHLQDYDNAIGAVSTSAIASVDLSTGAFGAGFGDRMSGVLDLRSVTPSGTTRIRTSAGIAGFELAARGESAGESARWLTVARRGAIDLVGRLVGGEEPAFWDGLARADVRWGESATLAFTRFDAGDRLDLIETGDDRNKRFDTAYRNSHTWLSLHNRIGDEMLVESAAAVATIDRDRRGSEIEEDAAFTVVDRRDTSIREFRQSITWQVGERHTFDGGWQRRRIDTDFDYTGQRTLDDPLAMIRHDGPAGSVRFDGEISRRHEALHLADRVHIARTLALETGARWDRYDGGGGSRLSPRLGLAWAPSPRTVVRAAWGRYDQSQRPYELDVEDGATRLAPIERSTHHVLGCETRLGGSRRGVGPSLRVEIYRRDVDSPRERFEGLFEPVNTFPEIEPDRVRVAPDASRSEGLEIFLRGDPDRTLRWWLGYALASARDRLGARWAPRPFDQRHALDLGADFSLGRGWRAAAVWRFHTGWPTTAIAIENGVDAEGEARPVPLLGPLYGERLPAYHRLDVRLGRSWNWRALAVELAIDVQNAYDQGNVGGFDVEIDADTASLRRIDETWAGTLATAVVSIEF